MTELEQHECSKCGETFCEAALGADQVRFSKPRCPTCRAAEPAPVRIRFGSMLVVEPLGTAPLLPEPGTGGHIPNEAGDCPSWCPACHAEARARKEVDRHE